MSDKAQQSTINQTMKSESLQCDSTATLQTTKTIFQGDLKTHVNKMTNQTKKISLFALQDCYPLIGMIRINWFNKKGSLICINYGTAFAISSRLILTCAHNIYSQKKDLYCSQIFFYPGSNHQLTQQTKRYKSAKNVFFKNKKPQKTMVISPLKQELAMIILEEQLQNESYLKVGTIQDLSMKSDLSIIGYPSQGYCRTVDLNDIQVRRQIVKGGLYKIRQHMIHHTMTTTKIGHSGSPILIKNKENELQVIGIHTHRGMRSEYNSGLFFNQQILGLIKKYRQQLEIQHKVKQYSKTETVHCEKGIIKENADHITFDDKSDDQDYQNTSSIDQYDDFYSEDFQQQFEQQSQQPSITQRESWNLKDRIKPCKLLIDEQETTKSQFVKVTVGLKSIHQISGGYYLE